MRVKTALGLACLFSFAVAVFCLMQYLEERNVGKKKATVDHLAQGQQLLQTGKYALAIAEFRQCSPDNCKAMLGIAECSYFLGNDANCTDELMAIARSGNKECFGRALLIRGLVHKRQKDIRGAKECFHAAILEGELLARNELDALGG